MSNTTDDVHDWNARYNEGIQGEGFLDAFFSEWFLIRKASRDEQRQGIDRFYTRKFASSEGNAGETVAIEYKTDKRAFETGNAFVEVTSVDSASKPGWAYTSKADYLMYYLPDGGLIYMMSMETIRSLLPRWQSEYRLRPAKNRDYNTLGLLVPLAEFEEYSHRVIECG